jgi:hypothetical protein
MVGQLQALQLQIPKYYELAVQCLCTDNLHGRLFLQAEQKI